MRLAFGIAALLAGSIALLSTGIRGIRTKDPKSFLVGLLVTGLAGGGLALTLIVNKVVNLNYAWIAEAVFGSFMAMGIVATIIVAYMIATKKQRRDGLVPLITIYICTGILAVLIIMRLLGYHF